MSKLSGSDDTPYDTRTHNTVNEITSIDPQGAVSSFDLDWGEGASKSGNLPILPHRRSLLTPRYEQEEEEYEG